MKILPTLIHSHSALWQIWMEPPQGSVIFHFPHSVRFWFNKNLVWGSTVFNEFEVFQALIFFNSERPHKIFFWSHGASVVVHIKYFEIYEVQSAKALISLCHKNSSSVMLSNRHLYQLTLLHHNKNWHSYNGPEAFYDYACYTSNGVYILLHPKPFPIGNPINIWWQILIKTFD